MMAALTLASCGKSNDDIPEAGNLNVSVRQLAEVPFDTFSQSAIAEVCTRMNFALYDQSGSRIKQVNAMAGSASFGTGSFGVGEGTYQLVVVAHSAGGNPTMSNSSKIQFSNATGYSDTFLYSEDVTVGDEPLNLQVTLERIVALCRFVVTDDIPVGVARMQFYYTGGSGSFNASTGLGCVNSKQKVLFDIDDNHKQFDLYTFPHEHEDTLSLTVTALSATDEVMYERDFVVPVVQNQISWLTGAYFTGSAISDFTVTSRDVNTEWDGESHYTF